MKRHLVILSGAPFRAAKGAQSKDLADFRTDVCRGFTGSFDSAPRRLRPPRRSAQDDCDFEEGYIGRGVPIPTAA